MARFEIPSVKISLELVGYLMVVVRSVGGGWDPGVRTLWRFSTEPAAGRSCWLAW